MSGMQVRLLKALSHIYIRSFSNPGCLPFPAWEHPFIPDHPVPRRLRVSGQTRFWHTCRSCCRAWRLASGLLWSEAAPSSGATARQRAAFRKHLALAALERTQCECLQRVGSTLGGKPCGVEVRVVSEGRFRGRTAAVTPARGCAGRALLP